MNKLLFITAHLPSPNAREAGQKTVFRNLEWLSQKYEIHLVSFCNAQEKSCDRKVLSELCRQVQVFDLTRMSRLQMAFGRPALPVVVGVRSSRSVMAYITDVVRKVDFARVHCEYGQIACYWEVFKKVSVKTINIHDVLTQAAHRRLALSKNPALKFIWKLEYIKTKKWEPEALAGFDRIYVPSRKDLAILSQLAPSLGDRITVLPPHFHRFVEPDQVLSTRCREEAVLFWGAMTRPENVDGMWWFCKNVLPLIRRKHPLVKLYIVGNGPIARLQSKFGAEGVALTGFVPDPSPYFLRARVSVVPLLYGAGVKVKTLECMAAGLPVVATEVGSEGIDAGREDGLITVAGNDPQLFANEVCRLLEEVELSRTLGCRAAQWVSRNYSPHASMLGEI